jgi:MFS family permease
MRNPGRAVLAGRTPGPDFRRFLAGYATSALGTSMASVALTFAVLDAGGSPTALGVVLAAGIVPQVLFMLGCGVIADRFGRRRAMLAADAARCGAQTVLAVILPTGHPPVWALAVLTAARGAGDALFTPALIGLTLEITSGAAVGNANALLGAARSAAQVAGPALAGLLITVTGPAVVIAVDAASYAACGLALAGLRAAPRPGRPAQSALRDLRDGWAEFRGHRWLVITTVQFTLFNLLTWGPFLLLGPVLARGYLGGARAWGPVLACYGLGSVLGGLLALGRSPRRPVAAGTAACLGYALPGALLALHAPLWGVAAGALAAGTGSGLGAAFSTTAEQRLLPPGRLARVSSFQTVAAFALGPLAFAAAGPVAGLLGARTVLGFGAVWSTVSCLTVLALPAVRQAGQHQPPRPTTPAARPRTPAR